MRSKIKIIGSIIAIIADILACIKYFSQQHTFKILPFIINNPFVVFAIIVTVALISLFIYWWYEDTIEAYDMAFDVEDELALMWHIMRVRGTQLHELRALALTFNQPNGNPIKRTIDELIQEERIMVEAELNTYMRHKSLEEIREVLSAIYPKPKPFKK